MANTDLTPVSTGPRTASGPTTLRTQAVLTSSYVVSTNDVNTIAWEVIRFGIDYNDGDETTVQFYVEGYDGSTWRVLTCLDTPSAGVYEVYRNVLQFTPANFDNAGESIITPRFDCVGIQKVRTYQKATGGTPTGTFGVVAIGGIGITATGR